MTAIELHSLIDGHHAAMKAQVDDPAVALEKLKDGAWRPSDDSLHSCSGVDCRWWHRIAPPKPVRRKAWILRHDLRESFSIGSLTYNEPTDDITRWLPIEWDEPPAPTPEPARECWINWYPDQQMCAHPTKSIADASATVARLHCQRVVMEKLP